MAPLHPRILVRACEPADVPMIEATEPAERQYARSAHRRQEEGVCRYLIAWLEDEPVGSGEVAYGAPPELKNLHVRQDHRRKGIGAQIIAAAEEIARKSGSLAIGVSDDNDSARSLYLRLGYLPTGRVETYRYSYVDDAGRSHETEETAEYLVKPL